MDERKITLTILAVNYKNLKDTLEAYKSSKSVMAIYSLISLTGRLGYLVGVIEGARSHLGCTTCQEDTYLEERLALKGIPSQLEVFRAYGVAKDIVFCGKEA